MTERSGHDPVLDGLLAEARRDTAPLSDDLFARIMADAADVRAAPRPVALPPPRPSLLALLGAALGGWPAAAGLGTAALAGVWIGVAPPAPLVQAGVLPASTAQVGPAEPAGDTAYELGDLMPGFDALGSEG